MGGNPLLKILKMTLFKNMPKIILYAIADKGEGRVMRVGEFESIEEIEILNWMFDKNVVFSLEYDTENKEN
jgi:hypothetical protein